MRLSIRTRLFLAISFLIMFFVAFSLLLNSKYLGKYYVWQKEHTLEESKRTIDEIYKGDPEEISLELENLERNRGLNIYFLSPNFELKYNSYSRNFIMGLRRDREDRPEEGQENRVPPEVQPIRMPLEGALGAIRIMERAPLLHSIAPKLLNLSKEGPILDVITDPRLKKQFIVMMSKLNNGDILILSAPIEAINESAAVANRFFMFTGLITLLLGGVAVFLFSSRFTRPILQLNEIAQAMSKLDFSKKYIVESTDEVGQLGSSINSLSDQLDEAISELTEANNKLKEDIERERRIDKMRKEFISNVSHELKTPIALIQGYAEGLKLNVNEDEENRNFYCDVIMDETDKMNRLVKDLLDLSQIESGYFKIEKTEFDISGLIDSILDKYRPILAERNIILNVKKDGNMIVSGDMVRIEQVIVNYLNNALNHVDENKQISVTVADRNEKVRVSVYNSGRAIPEESINKIWTSFYKVDKARTRAYGGTGLGLSVVRAILELHHNGYGVENKDQGVMFWFELDRIS